MTWPAELTLSPASYPELVDLKVTVRSKVTLKCLSPPVASAVVRSLSHATPEQALLLISARSGTERYIHASNNCVGPWSHCQCGPTWCDLEVSGERTESRPPLLARVSLVS